MLNNNCKNLSIATVPFMMFKNRTFLNKTLAVPRLEAIGRRNWYGGVQAKNRPQGDHSQATHHTPYIYYTIPNQDQSAASVLKNL
jgi:hypothetical protein